MSADKKSVDEMTLDVKSKNEINVDKMSVD